jgi:dihydrofolate reductase
MRRIRYSVAMSLDGYIAGPNGEYDWIEFDANASAAYFKAFYAQFDTALMGRKSYEHGKVTVLGTDALERIAALREEPGKDIWLWGGGELFGSLAAAGLVDTVEIGLIPVLLGEGRKVMAGCNQRINLVPRPTDLSLMGTTLLVFDVQK